MHLGSPVTLAFFSASAAFIKDPSAWFGGHGVLLLLLLGSGGVLAYITQTPLWIQTLYWLRIVSSVLASSDGQFKSHGEWVIQNLAFPL